jgi:hypothetical protein
MSLGNSIYREEKSMRSRNWRLQHLATTMIVVWFVVTLATPAQAIDNSCYYRVSDVVTISTYGEIVNPDGSKSYVPMGSTTYVYYDAYCDPSTGELQYGGPTYVPLKPKVQFVSVNTVDPYRPLLVVDVDSDPYQPASTLKVTFGGVNIMTLPIAGAGKYEVSLPSVSNYTASVSKSIVATACTPANACGSASGSMTRYKPPALTKDQTINTAYIAGDEYQWLNYGHQFLQGYMTTSWSMAELGQNSRRQLRNSLIKLQWNNDSFNSNYNAVVKTSGTFYGNTFNATPTCYDVPVLCSGYCAHRCVDSAVFGFVITAQDVVSDIILTESWKRLSITSGGTLTHTIP